MTEINEMGVLAYFRGARSFITRERAKEAVKLAGIRYRVPEMHLNGAVRSVRAAADFSRSDLRVELISNKRITSRTRKVEYGLLKRELDEQGRTVAWTQFDRCTWEHPGSNRPAEGWTSEYGTEEAANFIACAALWQTHLDYSWIRGFALHLVEKECHGFPLPGGRIYYVHGDQLAVYREYEQIINGIDNARLVSIKVDPRDDTTRENIAEAAEDNLSSRLNDVMNKLTAWQDRDFGRGSTLEKLLEDIRDVRLEAENLSTVLQFSDEQLRAQVAQVEGRLRETMASISWEPGGDNRSHMHGGVIKDLIKCFEHSEKKDGLTIAELDEIATELGVVGDSARTEQRIRIAVKMADAVKRDPRFRKVARGTYTFTPDEVAAEETLSAMPASLLGEAKDVDVPPQIAAQIPETEDELYDLEDDAYEELMGRIGVDLTAPLPDQVAQALEIRKRCLAA